MMAWLLDSLEAGKDIGHYGRLVFAMVAANFLNPEEIVSCLSKDPDCDVEKATALVNQVQQRGYNPPKRERILDWMQKQAFPICPDVNNPSACNVYKDFEFPREIYEHIQSFYTAQTA